MNERVAFYKYIYEHKAEVNNTIVTTGFDYYEFIPGLTTSFYTPEKIKSYVINDVSDLEGFLEENSIDRCFYIHRDYKYNEQLDDYIIKENFRVYPANKSFCDFLKSVGAPVESMYRIEKKNHRVQDYE